MKKPPKPREYILKRCEHCNHEFKTIEAKHQRGKERRFCSVRCRDSAYFKRRARKINRLQEDIQVLGHQLAKLQTELKQVREG
jgi:hypothetical protein